MVQSSSISITPATHADNHKTGGSDPLTGAVGIDVPNHASEHELNGSDLLWGSGSVGDVANMVPDDTTTVHLGSDIAAAGKKMWQLTFYGILPGTYRVGYYARRTDAANAGYARIYVDGVAQTPQEIAYHDADFTYYYEDVAIDRDSVIALYCYGGAGNRWIVSKAFGIYAVDTENIRPAVGSNLVSY